MLKKALLLKKKRVMKVTIKNQTADLESKKLQKKNLTDFITLTNQEAKFLERQNTGKLKMSDLTQIETGMYYIVKGKLEIGRGKAKNYNATLDEKNIKIEGQIQALKIERKANKILEEAYKQLKELVPADKVATFGMVVDGGGYKLKQIKAVKISCKKEAMKKISIQAEAKAQKDGSKGKTNE